MKLLTSGLQMTPKLASRMFSIVTWAVETGFLSACGSFLRLYNKGTEPYTEEAIEAFERNEAYIQANTYFGMLLEPVYKLRQVAKQIHDQRKAELQALVNKDSSTNDINSVKLPNFILGF